MSQEANDELLVQSDGAVVRVIINRPSRRNALTAELIGRLLGEFRRLATDPTCRVVVLTGADESFCSGADLRLDRKPDLEMLHLATDLITVMTTMPQPIIARVPGPAVGIGVPIAIAADLVVAAESAYFLLSFVDIALMPDGGATALVPAHIGRARAMQLALSPERLPAVTAQAWGLIHRAVPDTELDETVALLAERFSSGAAEALAATKAAVNQATLGGLHDALRREAEGQDRLIGTADFEEALNAFAAKRPPRFR